MRATSWKSWLCSHTPKAVGIGEMLSRWHVVESGEVWHFYTGAPLELLEYDPSSGRLVQHVLGDVRQGHESVAVIPPGVWQGARTRGDYRLELAASLKPPDPEDDRPRSRS